MKSKDNRRSSIDTLDDADFSSDSGTDSPMDFPIGFPTLHSAIARYYQPGRLFGADFRNDALVGFRSTDTVDYSLLGQNTSITANLAKGKVDKIFGGAAPGQYICSLQVLHARSGFHRLRAMYRSASGC